MGCHQLRRYTTVRGALSTNVADHGLGKSSNVVAHMIDSLNLKPGSNVFADNYFMSMGLLQWATKRKIGLTGTVRRNRLGVLPEFDVGRAKGSYKSIIDEQNGIIYTQWLDRKLVTIASNTYSCEPLKTVTVGKGKARK